MKKYILSNQNKAIRAFTLTEILIAMGVLAILIYSIFTLFSGTVKSVDIGQWKAQAQIKMRTSIKQLNKDISAATYPSVIKPGEVTIESPKATPPVTTWNLKYKNGAVDPKTFSGNLLEFYISQPGRSGFKEPDKPRKIIKAIMKCDNTDPVNKKLVYEKNKQEGADDPSDDLKKIVLFEYVTSFSAQQINNATTGGTNLLKIEVQCTHPKYPKTTHTEFIEIPLQVETATM